MASTNINVDPCLSLEDLSSVHFAVAHRRGVTKYCHNIIVIGVGNFWPRPQNFIWGIITGLFVLVKIIQPTMQQKIPAISDCDNLIER